VRFSRLHPRIAIRALAGAAALGLLVIALSYSPSGSVSATHLMPCADVDGDGTTSGIDLRIETSWFGSVPAPAAADMNGDTMIDFASDISYVVSRGGEFEQTWSGTLYVPCQDTPIGFNGSPPAPGTTYVDTDLDGCSDVEEGGTDPGLGGMRDYLDPWDFFDTNGDKVINLFGDIFGAAMFFGADADTLNPPSGAGLELEPDGYATRFDRSGASSIAGLGPPDGVIGLFVDIFGVADQFGHDCTAPPN